MRVDFYEMGGRFTDPLYVAGVLVSKAWPGTRDIAVVGAPDDLAKLDEQMWAQPEGRFLPHERGGTKAPIRLLEQAPEAADILINLDPASALPDGRFQRILEIVPPDESLKQKLRERWMAWKKRGAELQHHVLK
ncbi:MULTISPECIES: DNA polymerase III subunit chi [unclassified Wenzhouxiangella]|uniref:DNA polymerase III subunit chi n=1 Tax=unclassified Wenzhouxiangella TaxID=2613841 RepID=UPI000E32AB76|nr:MULTISPECIES: DNA polymerase III subunit chi [unclassified Wenzhouxiangella]RFF27738.1 DNA polymerase III subunit chi [Wenzhouxiangella sp. 15181]RFP69041.1 DNA polymerase III subunit chi [Wenzhouxiangella sp. 15190]